MRIELVNLEDGKGEFARVYRPEELNPVDERVSLASNLSIKGRIRVAGAEVLVNGTIEGRLHVNCDRCLQPVDLPVTNDFALKYITGAEYEASTLSELTDNEMSVSVFDGEAIDVDEIVIEQILLSVPARTLCGPDCKGICPICHADRNVSLCSCEPGETDPRWAALKDLISGK